MPNRYRRALWRAVALALAAAAAGAWTGNVIVTIAN
jgi:hypothetical protein